MKPVIATVVLKPAITPALPGDLPDIAAIHVKSWQETYPGLVPQDYLDNLDVKDRLAKWEEAYKHVESKEHGLLMAHVSEKPVGFISMGPPRDDGLKDYGEIYAVYLLQGFWQKGIGYKLFEDAADWFKAAGYKKIYTWVLDTNTRAIHSYERWGGILDNNHLKHHEIGGQHIKEVLVTFDNI